MTSCDEFREEIERQVAEAVAARIRRGLEENGWSQQELARRSGVDVMQICRLLRCDIGLSAVTLVRLADAFGCSTDSFFPEQG